MHAWSPGSAWCLTVTACGGIIVVLQVKYVRLEKGKYAKLQPKNLGLSQVGKTLGQPRPGLAPTATAKAGGVASEEGAPLSCLVCGLGSSHQGDAGAEPGQARHALGGRRAAGVAPGQALRAQGRRGPARALRHRHRHGHRGEATHGGQGSGCWMADADWWLVGGWCRWTWMCRRSRWRGRRPRR